MSVTEKVQQSWGWFYQALSDRGPCTHTFLWFCEGPLRKLVALVTFLDVICSEDAKMSWQFHLQMTVLTVKI